MKLEITLSEVIDLNKEIRNKPGSLFAMIRANLQGTVGEYLKTLMDLEMTHFLGRKRYERSKKMLIILMVPVIANILLKE